LNVQTKHGTDEMETAEFNSQSTLLCPDCGTDMHVGTVGEKNLATHHNLKACKAGYGKKLLDAKNKYMV
jgi:hypothetical protein